MYFIHVQKGHGAMHISSPFAAPSILTVPEPGAAQITKADTRFIRALLFFTPQHADTRLQRVFRVAVLPFALGTGDLSSNCAGLSSGFGASKSSLGKRVRNSRQLSFLIQRRVKELRAAR
jgi:hypothetical protein